MTGKDDKYFFELKDLLLEDKADLSYLEKFNLISVLRNYAHRKLNEGNTDFKESILQKIAPFNDVPIVFTSVINKQRIFDVLKVAMEVYQNYSRKIPTAKLNEALLPEIENHQPPMYKGKDIKIKFITQLPTRTPSFAFFCNLPQYIKDPYKRFLENKLRSYFNFTGCPVNVFLRQK